MQPPVERPVSENSGGEDLKKMLEDLMGIPQEEIPKKEAVKPVPVVHADKRAAHVPKKEKQVVYEAMHKEPVHSTVFPIHPKVALQVAVEAAPEEEAVIDFDIRQAIIYSEILKRPQY